MKAQTNKILHNIVALILGIVIGGISINNIYAWIAPSASPPGGSVTGPLTTSGDQTKSGALLIDDDLSTNGVFSQDHSSDSYDLYIQGFDGVSRNLALLGLDNDSGDYLRINHNNEYSRGTRVNGKLSINTNGDPASNLVLRTAGNTGSDGYCDQNGGNCSTPAEIRTKLDEGALDTSTFLNTSATAQTKTGALTVNGVFTTNGVLYQDQSSDWYDIYIAGHDGSSRNLALLGYDNNSGDYLRINFNNEYAAGTRVNGKLSVNSNNAPVSNLSLLVAGNTGSAAYCDEAGNNCTTPGDIRNAVDSAGGSWDSGTGGGFIGPGPAATTISDFGVIHMSGQSNILGGDSSPAGGYIYKHRTNGRIYGYWYTGTSQRTGGEITTTNRCIPGSAVGYDLCVQKWGANGVIIRPDAWVQMVYMIQ